jgi:hypothetical protein
MTARLPLSLETETARHPAQAHGRLKLAYERRSTSNGQENAVPLALKYGITDRLEFAIEPAAHISIRPKAGHLARRVDVTEAKHANLGASGTDNLPAFAVVGDVELRSSAGCRDL